MSASSPKLFVSENFTQSLTAYVVYNAAFRFLGLARGILLTWLIVTTEYGLFHVTLLIINVLMPLCSLGLNEAVARYVPAYETEGQLRSFLCRAVPLVLGTAALLTGIMLLAAPLLANQLFNTFSTIPTIDVDGGSGKFLLLTRLAACSVLAVAGYFMLISILKALRMFRALGLMEFCNAAMFLGSACLFVLIGYRSAEAIVACYLGSLVVTGIVFSIPLARMIRRWDTQRESLTERSVARRMLSFSLWAAFAAIVWQLLQYYPLWYLNKAHGPELAGQFSGVRHLTQFVLVGSFAVMTVVMTMVTKTWEARGREVADRQLSLASKAVILAALAGSILLAIGRDYLVSVLGPDYRTGAEIVPALLVFFLLAANLGFLSMHFNLIEKTRLLVWPWMFGMAANVVLGIRWIGPEAADPLRPLHGAADAGVIAMLAALVICIVLLRAERRPVRMAQLIVIASTGLLYTDGIILILGGGAFLVLAVVTSFVFDDDEKRHTRILLSRWVSWVTRRDHPGSPPAPTMP